jgi:hypothetical protein
MTRWKRAAYVGLCSLALAFLSSCGQVQEAPQGITGVWQARVTDNSTFTHLENIWTESTTGNNVVEKTASDFLDGTYVGSHLTLRWRFEAGTPQEQITTINADKSGNRLINGTFVNRRVSDNTVTDSGTFEGDFVMHPADLRTNFYSAGPGLKDLSSSWWGPTNDINVTWNGSRYAISATSSNTNPLPISEGWTDINNNNFIVRANVGGSLPKNWYSSAEISENGQMFWIKTAERRVALVRITNAATGTYEYAYPYGNYTLSSGYNRLSRWRMADGPEQAVAFIEMKNPDTNTPVELNRMNASTMEVEYIPSSGDPVKVPFQGSPTGWRSDFYIGTSNPGFYLQGALVGGLAPAGGLLSTGNYRIRARDTQGYEYFEDVYFDNSVTGVPFVDNGTMAATWDNVSLRLSWDRPAGLTTSAFPGAQFIVLIRTKEGIDNTGDGLQDYLYATSVSLNDNVVAHTLTVPSSVYGYLTAHNAGDLVWNVIARVYRTSPEGRTSEVYSHYSNWNILPGRPDTTFGAYLQLRKYADGTQRYVMWSSLDGPMGWNIPFDGGTVTSIALLDNTGTPVALQAGSQKKFGGPYWQTVPGGAGSTPAFGLTHLRGYNGWPDVPVGSLSPGVYTVRIDSASGTFDQQLYYPGDEPLPAVSSGTMSSTVNDNGSVALSWQAPAGFDGTMSFTVALRSTTQDLYPDIGYDEFLYAGVNYNPASTFYSLTIPKYVADYARSLYAAGQVAWYVQTRKSYLYNELNANVARSNSATSAFPY